MNRRNFIRNFFVGAAGLTALGGGGIFYYVNRPEFGRKPSGTRLEKMLASPHYFGDHFECLTPVQIMSQTEGERENRFVATWKFLFGDKTGLVPPKPIRP